MSDLGASERKQAFLVNELRSGQGVGGSAACWVGRGKSAQVNRLALDSAAWTIDLTFRLDGAFDTEKGHALWYYAWDSWRRGRILTRFRKDRCLEIAFFRPASQNSAQSVVDFKAASHPLDVSAGRFHTVRVALTAEGELSAYYDGVLAVKKCGCPGVQGIRSKVTIDGYPLFRIGQDDDDPRNPRSFLEGVVDDVAVYETALGAPAISFDHATASGAAAADEPGDSVLVLAKGRGQTGRFAIKDKVGDGVSDGLLLGAVVRAEEKFQKCRARADVAIDEKFVTVEIPCPVPEGVEVKRSGRSPWSGDAVEIFLRPDLSRSAYLHYAINAAGLTGAEKYENGSEVAGWKSAFKGECRNTATGFVMRFKIPRSEVFAQMPQDGDVFAAQFIRVGPTTAGVASWKPAGTSFHDPSTFGLVVYGSCGAYFARQVSVVRKTAAERFTDVAAKAEAEKAIAEFASAVEKHGGNAVAFAALEAMQDNLSQTFLQISLRGKRLLAYRPADVWGNDIGPDALTMPIEKVTMRAARGGKAFAAFAVANLSDRPYIGQVKVVSDKTEDMFQFNKTRSKGLVRHLTIGEGLSIQTGAGRALWDPVAPMPMGTVLRIAPHATSLVWLELDAKGLKAGRYMETLCLKRGVTGFETEMIPLEVEVIDANLDEVEADRACYTYMTTSTMGPGFAKFFVARDFNVIYAGTPGMSSLPIYPRYNREGRLVPGDMCALDRIIDHHIAAGMEKNRIKLWFFLAIEVGFRPEGASPLFGEKWKAAYRVFFEQLYSHVEEKYGITADRIFIYPVDEPSGDPDDPKSKTALACRAGEALRSLGTQYRLLVNPLSGIGVTTESWRKTIASLSKFYDIVELYRPGLTPERLAFARTLPFKEVWTYSIFGKETHPVPYRRDYWENLRDGFREIATFWHMDGMAGGDGLDSTDTDKKGKNPCDYGMVYADWELDQVMTSRRQVASDMGFEEARLVLWLRAKAKAKGDAVLSAKIDAIVKKAADAGSMKAMDAARDALLALAAETR